MDLANGRHLHQDFYLILISHQAHDDPSAGSTLPIGKHWDKRKISRKGAEPQRIAADNYIEVCKAAKKFTN